MIHIAIGDPQAPFETFLAILEAHRLLKAGRLRDDVQLVSMGDHFDWGKSELRAQATADGVRLLEWLASHSPEQVVIIAGNHDLARVCELQPFVSDSDFEAAWALARAAYRDGDVDEALEAQFLEKYPHVPDAECIARDFSCFSVRQRELVTSLLKTKRLRLAHEHAGLLLVHAGITNEETEDRHAKSLAASLNRFLDERVERWTSGPLDLTPLHQPGSAAGGEARGIFFHRPAQPTSSNTHQFAGPPRRRFDPRTLPSDFPQAIGHIRDKKARELLGTAWADATPARDGVIRSLSVEGENVRYRHGAHADARLYFLDCGMSHVAPESYELFDLDARATVRVRTG
ncbi:MAG: metallophosphoesterase [Archangium sp.]|nr:metallophosphoesterase [Archangium sp.]